MIDKNSHIRSLTDIDSIEKLLIEGEVLNEDQLRMAQAHLAIDKDMTLSDAIIRLNLASESKLLKVLMKSLGMFDSVFDDKVQINDKEKIKSFPFNLSKTVSISRGQVVVDWDEEKKEVTIAINNITDPVAKNTTLEKFNQYGYKTKFVVTTKMNLAFLFKSMYEEDREYTKMIEEISNSSNPGEYLAELNSLIHEYATLDRSSDIFFEHNKYSDYSYIYFRVDRQKKFKLVLPQDLAGKYASFIKQKSGMEAGKMMGHQDGSMEVLVLNNAYTLNMRTSSITTIGGEQITLRLQTEERLTLEELGIEEDDVESIKKELFSLKGIVVLSGVTGSGKTTTLYSMLSMFDPDKFNIITMEDPVEIRVRGLQQVQINEEAGQGFSETIRAILRQAPDIVLLGEIRDKETALRAVEAALTGHLVLCTIHCDSVSPGIAKRLNDLGIEKIDPIIDQISVGIYQELVPKEGGGLKLAYEIATASRGGMKNVKKIGL